MSLLTRLHSFAQHSPTVLWLQPLPVLKGRGTLTAHLSPSFCFLYQLTFMQPWIATLHLMKTLGKTKFTYPHTLAGTLIFWYYLIPSTVKIYLWCCKSCKWREWTARGREKCKTEMIKRWFQVVPGKALHSKWQSSSETLNHHLLMKFICPPKYWTVLIANTIIPSCISQSCIFLNMSPLQELKCLTLHKCDYLSLACNSIPLRCLYVRLTFTLRFSRLLPFYIRQFWQASILKHEHGPQVQSC